MYAALCFLLWHMACCYEFNRNRAASLNTLGLFITNLLTVVIISLTFGRIRDRKHGMLTFFHSARSGYLRLNYLFLGLWYCFQSWNISTQYAWAFVGLLIVEVITSTITAVIGGVVGCLFDLVFYFRIQLGISTCGTL